MSDARHIGLVGCGRWGRLILRDLKSLGCTVFVVATSSESRQNAESGRADAIVAQLRDLPEADGYVVASTTVTHAEVIGELLDRGAPVFTEKPMTCDLQSARNLAGRGESRLFVMDKWRYHPGVERLGEIARSGELGEVIGLQTWRLGWGNPHLDVHSIWILAPHDLSMAIEILGRIPTPRAAVASRWEGVVSGLKGLLHDDGPWHALEVSSAHPRTRRAARLECEDGVAILSDSYESHIEVYRPGWQPADEVETIPISTAMPLLRELEAFVAFLDGGPPPRSSALEGLAVVEAIERLLAFAGIAGLGR